MKNIVDMFSIFMHLRVLALAMIFSQFWNANLGARSPCLRKKYIRSIQSKGRKNPIREVVIVAKRNCDFEYFSVISRFLRGKGYALNRISESRYQRYICRKMPEKENDALDMSGVYAVIILGESLRNWMGHGTIVLEYIRYGCIEAQVMRFPIEVRDVADDRQIFIFLDPSLENEGKFFAWKVTLQDHRNCLSFSESSSSWRMVMKKT